MESLSVQSQRLSQSFFQLCAISSANTRPTAIFQDELELAVRDGSELKYAVNIDDRRSMYANKTHGIQPICEFIEGDAIEEFLACDVQVDIDACTLDPVNVHHANEACGSSGLYDQSVKPATGRRFGGDHAQDTAAEFPDAAFIEACLSACEGGFEPFVAEGFKQIIERVGLKGADGVLVVCGNKDGERHGVCPNSFDHFQAVELGHLHIEEDEIKGLAFNNFNSCLSIAGFEHGPNSGHPSAADR